MVKLQDTGLLKGNIGKFCITIALLCFCSTGIFSQAINPSSLSIADIDTVEVRTICLDYLSKYSYDGGRKWNKYVLFVDYDSADSMNTYIVEEFDMIYNLRLKKPDAYMFVPDTLFKQIILVLIYTQEYEMEKSATWYKQVLNSLIDYFENKGDRESVINEVLSNPNRKYFFCADTLTSLGNYEDKTILYHVKNRNILNTKIVNKLLYEYDRNELLPYSPPSQRICR